MLLLRYLHYSVCIKFDEASDVQMHGKLNVFVISCLYTGEVKTLTLALHGWYIVYLNVAFHSTIVLYFLCLTSNVTIATRHLCFLRRRILIG